MDTDPVVGDGEYAFLDVCNLLRESPSFETLVANLVELARNLQLPGDLVHKIKLGLSTQGLSYQDALWEILVVWRSKFSNQAKFSVLVGALRTCGVADGADKLEEHFNFKTKRRRTATFAYAPDGMTEFLNSDCSVLVISTMDKHVTATKLMDTGSSTHMHDHIEFANNLWTSESRDQVYSVACSNEFTLSEILDIIEPTIKCRAVVITQEKLEDIHNLCSGQSHVMITRDTLKWSQLSPARKLTVKGNKVKVSGKLMSFREAANIANVWDKLNEAVDENTLLELVYNKQPSILAKSVPDPIKFYVPRRVSSRTLLRSDKIFKKSRDEEILEAEAKKRDEIFLKSDKIGHDDVFVFTGIERPELTRYASPSATGTTTNQKGMDSPTVQYMVLDLKSDFDELAKKVEGSLHWIEQKDGKFYWVKSTRRSKVGAEKMLDAIQKARDTGPTQEEHSEETFLELLLQTEHTSNLPVLISDTPGMGKTLLLANLARQLQAKGNVVLFGVMSNLVKQLKTKLEGGDEMTTAVVDILSSLGGDTSPLSGEYLKNSLNSGMSNINVMLDGFDEVPSQDFELAGEILNFIRSNGVARLWVSTRPHLLQDLENCLQVLGHNILPLNSEDQRQCLVGYWKDMERCLEDKLQEYATACLDTLHKSMRSKDNDIAGVPLQCMIIGELYEMEARNYANPDNSTSGLLVPSIRIRSVTDLYKRLMEKKLDTYFERYVSSHKYERGQLKLGHMFFSIQLLFPDFTTKLDEILGLGLKVQLEDMLNVGLLEMVSEESPLAFIHRTVAEFFAALFVIHLIEKGRVTQGPQDGECRSFVSSVLECEKFSEQLFSDSNDFEDLNLRSYRFKHKVVLYFLDNLIGTRSEHKFELRVDRQHLAQACATGNFTRLFDYLRSASLFHDVLGAVWNNGMVFASVRHSEVELINTVCKMYEEMHDNTCIARDVCLIDALENDSSDDSLDDSSDDGSSADDDSTDDSSDNSYWNDSSDDDTKNKGHAKNTITLLDVAVAYREYSVVEHLVNCQGFKNLVEQHDESVRKVIIYCVENSESDDAALIREKMHTLQLLCGLNKLLMENKNYKGETPLLCSEVHLRLLYQLIRLGANVAHLNTAGKGFLRRVSKFDSPNHYNELVTDHIPRESLSKLVHHTAKGGRTPLHAIMKRFNPDPSILQLFKDLGADFNAIHQIKGSLIEIAVTNNRSIDTIEQLILHGAKWEQHTTPGGWSVLHLALKHLNFPVFQHFSLKLTEDLYLKQQLRDASDWSGLGNMDLKKSLGLNLNVMTLRGNTLMHILVAEFISYGKHDYWVVMMILLQSGVGFHVTNNAGLTTFDFALKEWTWFSKHQFKAYVSILNLMLSHGAMHSQSHAYESLKTIVVKVSKSKLKDIVVVADGILDEWPLTLEQTDESGDTILHHAVSANNEYGVQYLLSKRADVNARNKTGQTPVHKAGSADRDNQEDKNKKDKSPAIVKLLAEHGGELTAVDSEDRTPLEIAVANRQGHIVEFLYSTGAYDDLEMLQHVLRRCDPLHPNDLEFNEYGTLLHVAARSASHSIFEFLFEGWFWESMLTDPRMHNVAHTVVRDTLSREHVDRQIDMLRTIKREKPELLNTLDSRKRTPLLCDKVHIDLLIWLLDNGADPTIVTSLKRNVLHISAKSRKPSEFLTLVEWVVKSNFQELLKAEDTCKNTPFHAAALGLKLEEPTLQLLLRYVDINTTNSNGDNLLFKAVQGKQSSTFLQMLISKGADWKMKNQRQQTVIHVAASNGNVAALRLFISNGMAMNDKDANGVEAIHYGASTGNMRALKLFVEKGCDVNVRDKSGLTPIHYTLLKHTHGNHLKALEFLIEQGADVYAKDDQGQTMLRIAAETAKNGNPNVYNSVLEWAVRNSYERLFKEEVNDINVIFNAIQGNRSANFINLLISKGAEWKRTNSKLETVLHVAASWGNEDALRFFIEKGCDVNARNNDGETVLHCAFKGMRHGVRKHNKKIRRSTYRVVKLLLENNAILDAKDSEGRTPMDVAVEKLQARKADSITIDLMKSTLA